MQFGIVEVIDPKTFNKLYDLQLGINLSQSIPIESKSINLPMITDGNYLYIICYRYTYQNYYKELKKLKKDYNSRKKNQNNHGNPPNNPSP